MAKKPAKTKKGVDKPAKKQKEAAQPIAQQTVPEQPKAATAEKKTDLDQPDVKKAIEEGQAVLKEGKSKADAAWVIYGRLKDKEKDLIVATFIKGATLTEKGALTYWYNCRKRATKEANAMA